MVWISQVTFAMPLFVPPTPLSPVLKVVSVTIAMSMSPSFACPQQLVVPALRLTLPTHPGSVPAGAHLQPHRAQTLQACPVILGPGQGVQRSVGQQTSSTFAGAGPLAPVPAALPAVVSALGPLQGVLQGVAAAH